VIAHGWADDPTKGWIAWLISQLKQRGIEAIAPQFPEPKRPDIAAWLKVLAEAVGQPDQELVLVGHSLGCLIVLKYLSSPTLAPIAGMVLVAGMPTTESWRPPDLYPIEYAKVEQLAPKRICIYSNDDDKVEPVRTKELAKLTKSQLILDPDQGHFAGLHGVTELPSALKAVLSCYTD
jgi:predicted alpha/beta hydrolase family esterase